MKPMIVYYSHTGNNQALALKLKDFLICDSLEIKEKKKRKTITILFDLMFNRKAKIIEYPVFNFNDRVIIFISPIWVGKIASPIKAYIEKEKNNINKYFFISLCGGDDNHQQKLKDMLRNITQKEPLEVLELSLNSLLPEEKRNQIKHLINFRVSDNDFDIYKNEINQFIDKVNNACI